MSSQCPHSVLIDHYFPCRRPINPRCEQKQQLEEEEEEASNDDTDIELDDEFNEESLLSFEKPPERRRRVTVLEKPHHHSGCSTLCAATYQAARQRRRTITTNCQANMSAMSTSEDGETSDGAGKVAPVRKNSRFQVKREESRKMVEGRWKLVGSRNYEDYLTELGKHLVLAENSSVL